MDLDSMLKALSDNPASAAAVGGVAAAVVGFFKPITKALQRALVRRIEQAWVEDDEATPHEERVTNTAKRVKSATLVPMPQRFVEDAVRLHKSEPPPG